MGRKKIDIEPITNERNKTVTFLKRKQGLFKKAFELSILCSVDIQVVILGSNRQFYEYTTVDPNEFNKVYYKDNMIHNIQTPFDYDENYSLKETIDLNDTGRYKGPWNPNGNTKHKRTHSGRLVYTDDDLAGNDNHNNHHSKTGSDVNLEDIFEQEHVNNNKRQKVLDSDSTNVKRQMELTKGVITENIIRKGKNRNNNSNNNNDDNEDDDEEEDDDDDDEDSGHKQDDGEHHDAVNAHSKNHISAKKRRANNSSLLKRDNSNPDLVGKGNSYMFPNPLANSNLHPINTNNNNNINDNNSNQNTATHQSKTSVSSNRFNKLPSLDTHKIGRSSQMLSSERNMGTDGSNKNANEDNSSSRGSSAGGSMQIKSQNDFANSKYGNKLKNENDVSDNDHLITPTSANSLAGLTFEPNLFTPTVSRLNFQQQNQQIRNSPQLQQESFSRRPRLRVEIPKTTNLTKQQEQMQQNLQRNNNPSNIIPLSARGMGTTPGPLSANLFSNMQFQSASGMMSSLTNQLNTPNLNMFINVGDKSAQSGNPHNVALRTSYFEDVSQTQQQQQQQQQLQQQQQQQQNVNNNNANKNRFRRPSESDFFGNTPTTRKTMRQPLQSPIFNSFLENGLIMSPDGTTNNNNANLNKLNFKKSGYPNINTQPHNSNGNNTEMGPLTAMGFGGMGSLDMLHNQDYTSQNQQPNNVSANQQVSIVKINPPTDSTTRVGTNDNDNHHNSVGSRSRSGTGSIVNVGSDKEGLTKVFPQLQRQKRQNMKESSNDDLSVQKQASNVSNVDDDDVVVPVSDKPTDMEKEGGGGISVNEGGTKTEEAFLINANVVDNVDVLKWEDK
ncbi:hypothetical protein ACO0SA_004327 [Hanseniaspora valbyensis]